MKKLQYIACMALLITAIGACKKEIHNFISDNTNPTGAGYYPISTNALVDTVGKKTLQLNATATPTSYTTNAKLVMELQIMSENPLKEINQYYVVDGVRTKVKTIPFKGAFSQIKRLDTIWVDFVVPVTGPDKRFTLEHEIMSENLSIIRRAYLRVP